MDNPLKINKEEFQLCQLFKIELPDEYFGKTKKKKLFCGTHLPVGVMMIKKT